MGTNVLIAKLIESFQILIVSEILSVNIIIFTINFSIIIDQNELKYNLCLFSKI